MRFQSLAVACLVLAVAGGGCLGSGPGGLFGGGQGPRDYLSADRYTKWVIELDAIQGQAPSASVLSALETRLEAVANKPDGIEIDMDETSLPARGGAWSDKDVADYSGAHHDRKTSGSTVVLHLLFLDGNSVHDASDGRVLGAAYGHGTLVLFSETIRESCGALCLTGTDSVFRAVLVHEFGHAMGLVDNGIPMVRPHEASSCNGAPDQGHSSNEGSVMNCNVETSNIFNVFRGGPPTDFDADDRADLCAVSKKC